MKREGIWPLPRPPWEWKEEDLLELITNEIAEDLHIEYKESRLLARDPQSAKDDCVEKITKTVSAFNNSDGGVIAIGVKERPKDNRSCPEDLDDGFTESDFSKTWLVQVINSNISPSIPDLRVNLIKLTGNRERKIACVIYVPKGTRAVQAKDSRYYQRVEDQSLPMKDFQVRDVNNRSLGPDLRMSFIIPPGETNQLTVTNGKDRTNPFRIAVVVSNLSDAVADLASFTIMLPERLGASPPKDFDKVNINPEILLRYRGRESRAYCRVYSRDYYPTPASPPIFKRLRLTGIGFLHITVRAQYEQIPHFEPLYWIAESPRMEPRCGSTVLIVDHNSFDLVDDSEARITLDGMEPLDYWRRQ